MKILNAEVISKISEKKKETRLSVNLFLGFHLSFFFYPQ